MIISNNISYINFSDISEIARPAQHIYINRTDTTDFNLDKIVTLYTIYELSDFKYFTCPDGRLFLFYPE